MTRIDNEEGVTFWNANNRSSGTAEDAMKVLQRCWPHYNFTIIYEEDTCNDSEALLKELLVAVNRWWCGSITELELKAVADKLKPFSFK